MKKNVYVIYNKELNDIGNQLFSKKKEAISFIRGVKDLDEASGAYKDIDIVMKNQEDLVEILVELTPLGVIKG